MTGSKGRQGMVEANDDRREAEFRRRRNTRNWVLFAVLVAFVVVVYLVSIVRMGASVP